ncbi:MAG: methylated-DNA--[protein]-cysteine S-methyltransferase, partial [Anaerolineae bacterium]|nr:methylated-DNA--[protein]-cysteine S-methyltransferase [Anaerolineae bacterium]
PSPLGTLHLASGKHGLVAIRFTDDTEAFLDSLDPMANRIEGGESISTYRGQLQEYLAGRRLTFTLATDLSNLTEFQRRVLKAIAEIPPGEVRSYGQVASAIGKPRAARAVGQALANNPIPIVLPCHRVLASDGGLGGYTG